MQEDTGNDRIIGMVKAMITGFLMTVSIRAL